MKIYKIAQDFQIIPQNSTQQNDPNVQLQNLQNSQGAIEYLQNVMSSFDQASAALGNLESSLGIRDNSLIKQLQGLVQQFIMQTQAFTLLTQMNFISSVDNLMDMNQIKNVEIGIQKNIQSIQSGEAQMMPMG